MSNIKFSPANAKTRELYNVEELQAFLKDKRKVYSYDLLSGWSCPGAYECLSKVYLINGKKTLKDGKNTKFRCFSASQEVAFPSTFTLRKNNFEETARASIGRDGVGLCTDLLMENMPDDLGICRIHVAGDFFSKNYLTAWINVANNNKDRLFYAYTKSLNFWLQTKKMLSRTRNFVLTASYGGRYDELIRQHRLRYAKVIFHPSQAGKLEIDHDDSHAARPSLRQKNFCLLLHGQQPAKSEANQAIRKLRQEEVRFEYNGR